MKTLSVRMVRNEFPRALRAIHSGETVQVTRRGKIVAVIAPPEAPWNAQAWANEVRRLHRGRVIRANLGALLAKDR